MSHRRRLGALAVVAAVAVTSAACGTGSSPGSSSPGSAGSPPALPGLATSVTTTGPAWAVVVMGGSAAQDNNFWQIFTRPPGEDRWRLVTPPGVASNGGFVIADGGPRSLTAGFRPSQDLVFTPLAATSDDGSAWTAGVLDASLSDVADALAAAGDGALLALLSNGTVQASAGGAANWTTLTTLKSLAASADGRRCGLRALTGTAFTPADTALISGDCTHPGVTGIFAESDHAWHLAGPTLAEPLSREKVSVLALVSTAGGVAALLAAGTGDGTSLIGAWSAGASGHWVMSAALPLEAAAVTSASFGPGGQIAIVLPGGRGEMLAGVGGSWQSLPALPPGTATLAAVSGGAVQALAVHTVTLTVWQLAPDRHGWQPTQVIKVPIQFGSSS
jgi:hypothetical protein